MESFVCSNDYNGVTDQNHVVAFWDHNPAVPVDAADQCIIL